jgi:hypothetical protein
VYLGDDCADDCGDNDDDDVLRRAAWREAEAASGGVHQLW